MRVAPVALDYSINSLRDVIRQAAEIAAITHGHPLGYIPAGILAGFIRTLMISNEKLTLDDRLDFTLDAAEAELGSSKEFDYQKRLISKAIKLAGNNKSDIKNIVKLGEGWVAEETLAIAIYCTFRYPDDFSKGIIAAVNHSGDSDSTGAVTGNILGAWLGIDSIDSKWIENLEIVDVITEIADDLDQGCLLSWGRPEEEDPVWEAKYLYGRRFPLKRFSPARGTD